MPKANAWWWITLAYAMGCSPSGGQTTTDDASPNAPLDGSSFNERNEPNERNERDAGEPTSDSAANNPPDANAGGAQTTDSSSSPNFDPPYFPLLEGLEWQYRLTKADGTVGDACGSDGRTYAQKIVQAETDSEGRIEYSFHHAPACSISETVFRINGNRIENTDSVNWYVNYDYPPEVGKSWRAGAPSGASFTWTEHFATYTVLAGTFSDCWKRKQNGYDIWDISCRNVGVVLSSYEAWGGSARSELVGKNF